MDAKMLYAEVDRLLREGNYDSIRPYLLSHKEITEKNNDLATICYLSEVHEKEKAAGMQTFFSKISNVEELIKRYTVLKFYLRRIDFGFMIEDKETFYTFLSANQISPYELLATVEYSVVHKRDVLEEVSGICYLKRKCGCNNDGI